MGDHNASMLSILSILNKWYSISLYATYIGRMLSSQLANHLFKIANIYHHIYSIDAL
jgi:hypothetical protein